MARFMWWLGLVMVCGLGLFGLYYYSLTKNSDIKINVVSTIDDTEIKLVDPKTLKAYLSTWTTRGRLEVGNFPTVENTSFVPIKSLTIKFVSSVQPHGNRVSDTDSNNIITSYDVLVAKNMATLTIHLDKGYWSKIPKAEVNNFLSALVVSDLYEITNFPPRNDWAYIDLQRPKIHVDVFSKVPIFSINFDE